MKAKDQYNKAAKWLTDNPKYIEIAWDEALVPDDEDFASIARRKRNGKGFTGEEHMEAHKRAACLFKNCGDKRGQFKSDGCLTQVAHGGCSRGAGTEELTQSIRADAANIPEDGAAIGVSDLPVFAEWRRRIDKEIKEATANA